MDIANKIFDYENGLLEFDEIVLLFQKLIDTGMINNLQGFYHRTAEYLIQEGHITLNDEEN